MSARTRLVSLSSIEPIREAVASGDEALIDAVVARRAEDVGEDGEEDEEFREWAESMIGCASPPREERGCWNHVIESLAAHLQLAPQDDLAINDDDWKHYQIWEPYRDLVAEHLTPGSRRSLEYLENGRPLRGKTIEADGCVFGWLTADEVKDLHQSLSRLDDAVIDDEDLAEFHEALVESLRMVSERNASLFMAAH